MSSRVSIDISEPILMCNQDLVKEIYFSDPLTTGSLTGSVTITTGLKCLQLADNSKELKGQKKVSQVM